MLCLQLHLEVRGHVLLGEGVGRVRGQLGIDRREEHVHQLAVGHRRDLHVPQKRAHQGRLVCGFVGLRRLLLDRGGTRDQFRQPPCRIPQHGERRRRGLLRSVELRHGREVEALHDAAGEIASPENAILRVVVRDRVLVVAVTRDAWHRGRSFVLDEQLGLCLKQLDVRVALDHQSDGRQGEDRKRDAPVAIDDRQTVEDVYVAVERIGLCRLTVDRSRRLRWSARRLRP
jgi:hypothetical protein